MINWPCELASLHIVNLYLVFFHRDIRSYILTPGIGTFAQLNPKILQVFGSITYVHYAR